MDIRQASDYLGISPDTLYKYASDGFVPAFKLETGGVSSVRVSMSGWTGNRTFTPAMSNSIPIRKSRFAPRCRHLRPDAEAISRRPGPAPPT